MSDALSGGPLLAYYGDDFTGSAAVMEVMTFAGLPTVLFLNQPTHQQLRAFSSYRGLGIAGIARSQNPSWMEQHLPPIFSRLAALEAPINHYKVCSTFDSAPHVGSIGKAVELAAPDLGGTWHPLLIAAPAIQRYQAMGNLFAIADRQGFRLDRHPTMSRHPVTPMDEADVRLHLARQTSIPIGLVDFVALKNGNGDVALHDCLQQGATIIALDVIDDQTLAEAGRLIWQHRGAQCLAIGSQGVEYALVAHWQNEGLVEPVDSAFRAEAVDQVVVVSGSCSPVTSAQISRAVEQGFEPIELNPLAALEEPAWEAALDAAALSACHVLKESKSPLIYTARGPHDPSIVKLGKAMREGKHDPSDINARLGGGLGRLLNRLIRETGVRRVVIAGGDTSSHSMRALDIYALTAIASITPGASLNRAHSDDPLHDGLEIALKGGQMGEPDYFAQVRAGKRSIH